MSIPSFPFHIESQNYRVSDLNGVIYTELKGGLPKIRNDKDLLPKLVNFTIKLNLSEYTQFRTFYNDTLENGSLTFAVSLLIWNVVPENYISTFIPRSLSISQQAGNMFVVSGQMQVQYIVSTTEYEETIAMLVSEYGDTSAAKQILFGIEQLVQTDLLGAIGE